MDVQRATVKRLKDSAALMNALNKAIQAARNRKMPVIYVVVGFRKGYPEVSPSNKSFSAIKSGVMNFDTEEATKAHVSVDPQPGDVIITKKRVSAFTGSDLEVVLRSLK